MQSDADINLMAYSVLFFFFIFFHESYAEHSKSLCHTTLLLDETKFNVLES